MGLLYERSHPGDVVTGLRGKRKRVRRVGSNASQRKTIKARMTLISNVEYEQDNEESN